MRKYFLIFSTLFLFTLVEGQNLKRSGYIGVHPGQSREGAAGVAVAGVLPNSTAEEMGMKPGDVILTINDRPLSGTVELIAFSQQLKEGDKMVLKIERDGKEKVLKGKAKGKMKNIAPVGETIYGEVPFKGSYLRSILNKPAGKGNLPVVYILQGYTCGSIDFIPDWHPYNFLVNDLVKKGYAVFRVEKPGVGDNKVEGSSDCLMNGFNVEVDGFKAGYKQLRKLEGIDPDRIFLFGHSMGGAMAPLVAEEYNPAGIMVYGTLTRSFYEYLLHAVRFQHYMLGYDYLENESLVRKHIVFLNDLLIDKLPPEKIASDEDYQEILESDIKMGLKEHYLMRHFRFWQELQDQNLIEAWGKVRAPVLTMYGEADVEAIGAEDAILIKDIVNKYQPGKATYHYAEGVNHILVEVGSKEEGLKKKSQPDYPRYIKQNFSYSLIDVMIRWMKGVEG